MSGRDLWFHAVIGLIAALAVTAADSASATVLHASASTFTGSPLNVSLQIDDATVPGDLVITLEVTGPGATIGDLRGFFIQVANESLLSGLSVTGANVTGHELPRECRQRGRQQQQPLRRRVALPLRRWRRARHARDRQRRPPEGHLHAVPCDREPRRLVPLGSGLRCARDERRHGPLPKRLEQARRRRAGRARAGYGASNRPRPRGPRRVALAGVVSISRALIESA